MGNTEEKGEFWPALIKLLRLILPQALITGSQSLDFLVPQWEDCYCFDLNCFLVPGVFWTRGTNVQGLRDSEKFSIKDPRVSFQISNFLLIMQEIRLIVCICFLMCEANWSKQDTSLSFTINPGSYVKYTSCIH